MRHQDKPPFVSSRSLSEETRQRSHAPTLQSPDLYFSSLPNPSSPFCYCLPSHVSKMTTTVATLAAPHTLGSPPHVNASKPPSAPSPHWPCACKVLMSDLDAAESIISSTMREKSSSLISAPTRRKKLHNSSKVTCSDMRMRVRHWRRGVRRGWVRRVGAA